MTGPPREGPHGRCGLRRVAALVVLVLALTVTLAPLQAVGQKKSKEVLDENGEPRGPLTEVEALVDAAVRLPVAALLGAALAFRPRRRGTPLRNPAVIQTQILLAVVGALVMLVVGSSLARAFGIVGAAGLIRYRAKIEDPKDAGVMLATLGVGLATGVGLYYLAVFAALFFLVMLAIVESLGEGHKLFELTIQAEDIDRLRPAIEAMLQRNAVEFELRSVSEKQLVYAVTLPLGRRTDRLSNAIHRVAPGQVPAVGWEERKVK